MGQSVILLLMFIVIFILLILIVSLILRLRNVEKRLVSFSPTEALAIMENMRTMVSECERIADELDSSIKDRESALEDLADIVDEKLARFEGAVDSNKREKNIKSSILDMHENGISESEIARQLGISLTEVGLAIKMASSRQD